ncbi:MAG: FGGY family carbohydrate kinase [Robiginitalea sp.]|uniref:xylulokinase n=1 Tax=Robiginitalea sp. TaxID=1902411 RepID=UPI003C767948
MYFIGYDLGSSSLKTALVDSETGETITVIKTPAEELAIDAPQAGWAEQDPELWWKCICEGTHELLSKTGVTPEAIAGIGIAYQMHGLVTLDAAGHSVRPAIIWCDSRAISIGDQSLEELGETRCQTHLLNVPGNFTASKLRWMQLEEPEAFEKTQTFLLPGDYIAYRLTGKPQTTASGLSEGILWDFQKGEPAYWLLEHWGMPDSLVPEIVPTFGYQAGVNKAGALATGLPEGTPVFYRAGDQPNNAFTLNVLEPGIVAATGGTSGVLYGITDSPEVTELRRFNHFLHVNHTPEHFRIGQLLCINGAGSLYRWLKDQLDVSGYDHMNALAREIPVGSDGLVCFPFGNGAERMLENKSIGASFSGLEFNRHHKGHLCRAALEGIAFAFRYGMELMEASGVPFKTIRAGNDNLFQSDIFTTTLATLGQTTIELFQITGAVGAARACMVEQLGLEETIKRAAGRDYLATVLPAREGAAYQKAYLKWKIELQKTLN